MLLTRKTSPFKCGCQAAVPLTVRIIGCPGYSRKRDSLSRTRCLRFSSSHSSDGRALARLCLFPGALEPDNAGTNSPEQVENQFFNILDKHKADAVVLDLMGSQGNGVAAIRRIR